jgi:hypothetical protein
VGAESEVAGEAKLRRRESGLSDGEQTDGKGRGGSSAEPKGGGGEWNLGAKKEVGAALRAWRWRNADTEKRMLRRAWREYELAGWTSEPRDAVRAAAAMAEDAIDLMEGLYYD